MENIAPLKISIKMSMKIKFTFTVVPQYKVKNKQRNEPHSHAFYMYTSLKPIILIIILKFYIEICLNVISMSTCISDHLIRNKHSNMSDIVQDHAYYTIIPNAM